MKPSKPGTVVPFKKCTCGHSKTEHDIKCLGAIRPGCSASDCSCTAFKLDRKGVGGCPSKKPENLLHLTEELAGCGLTEAQLAKALGVSLATIGNWKESDPEFLDTLNTAKDRWDREVVKSLRARSVGYSHKELICFQHRGKIITKEVIKHYPPDPTSMIFWLKNRDKENWRDRQEIDHGVKDETLEKYKGMTIEELKKRAAELIPGS